MWWLGYEMSVAVAIGFIALAGVAAETGVVMLIYPDHAHEALTAIMAGLVPILWSQGTGADVMKRIAAPMVGGMLTSTVLTLVVIPAVYSLWKEGRLSGGGTHGKG